MPDEAEESIASEVLSASLGGAVSASLLYPLEVIKTQMQAGTNTTATTEEDDEKEEDSINTGGTSMISHAQRLYSKDPLVFVRGLEISGFQSALEKALYFLAYTALKRAYLITTNQKHLNAIPNVVLGCAAEWAHLPLTLPVDAWTTRIQTSSTSAAGPNHQTPLAILLHMLKDPDCRFYSGISAYVLLCLKPALQYTVYEQVRTTLLKNRPNKSLSAAEAFLLGMVARTVSTVLVFPFLRAKVLLQASRKRSSSKQQRQPEASPSNEVANGQTKGSKQTPGPPVDDDRVLSVVWRMWRQQGLQGLYQGLGPELTRGVLSSALMLMIKERIAVVAYRLLQSYRHRRLNNNETNRKQRYMAHS
jgi:hypothetical protein